MEKALGLIRFSPESMEYARRLVAHRFRLLVWRFSQNDRGRHGSHHRLRLQERLRSSVSFRAPRTESFDFRIHKLKLSARDLRGRFRDLRWLMRLGIAGAAVIALLLAISASRSPQSGLNIFAGATNPGGASTRTSSLPQSAQTSVPVQKPTHQPGHKAATTTRHSNASVASPTAPSQSTALAAAQAANQPGRQQATPQVVQSAPQPTSAPPVRTVTVVRAQTITVTRTTPAPAPPRSTTVPPRSTQTTTTVSRPAAPVVPAKHRSSSSTGSGGAHTDGVMAKSAYDALTVGQTTLGSISSRFGSTATPTQLQRVFGANWLATFLQYQVSGESCVYYLDSSRTIPRAFQLCFNGANLLRDKAIINASSSGG